MESDGGTAWRDIPEERWAQFGGRDRRGIRAGIRSLETADSNASSLGCTGAGRAGQIREVRDGEQPGQRHVGGGAAPGWHVVPAGCPSAARVVAAWRAGWGWDSEAELCSGGTDLRFMSGCLPDSEVGMGPTCHNSPTPSCALCCRRDGNVISSKC